LKDAIQVTKAKLQNEDLSPERVTELRDAVLALVKVRGVKARRGTKEMHYSFEVDDLNIQHVDGSHVGRSQLVAVWQRKAAPVGKTVSTTPMLLIEWQGDKAPRVITYVVGPWLSRLPKPAGR
jgi:hypothetical protein